MKILANIMVFIFTLFKSLCALSQQGLAAHNHGQGHMTLVFENGHLVAEIITPTADILGFEHQPKSEKQWQELDNIKHKLQQPNNLITLKSTCQIKSSAVDIPFKRPIFNNSDSNLSPKTDWGDDRGDLQIDANHRSKHNDIHSRYEWFCNDFIFPEITFFHFIAFPNLHKIDVQWVVNDQQGFSDLNQHNNSLTIK